MARTAEQGAPAARSRPAGLVFFAIAVGALAVGETALVLQDNPVPWGWTAALFPLGGCVYVATGLLAWSADPGTGWDRSSAQAGCCGSRRVP
jgi:hypothetical protein